MLVTFHYTVIIINALTCSKCNTENIGVKIQITHSFIKRIRVSNACEMEFYIFISLGDE